MEDVANSQTANFIREITRQICHPKTGLPKDFKPPPVTIQDWKRCLSSLYGWVNLGIQLNMASLFHELEIGEVIPAINPNMDIYNNSFATNEIQRLLKTDSYIKDYRAVINYHSFVKINKILTNVQTEEYRKQYNKSLQDMFPDINPDNFWLNILVPLGTAKYLDANDIGETIVKEGSSGEMIETDENNLVQWELEEKSDGDNFEEDDFNEENLSDFSNITITKQIEKEKEESPYRLVMNNSTLLKLISHACEISNVQDENSSLFEAMGGQDEEFASLFGNLQI